MFAQQQAWSRLNEALFRYSMDRVASIRPDDRFAHYTTVDVAEKIISASAEERCIWLRNSRGMNDFSEVSHGYDCLEKSLNDWRLRGRFVRALNALKAQLGDIIIYEAFRKADALADMSYLTSLSLHDKEESRSGKLSMWRAYGAPNNVCLIFNTQPFVTPQTSMELVLSPVIYGGEREFKKEFEAFVQRLESCAGLVDSLDYHIIEANVMRAIDYAVLSTKHQGFHEEAEWRVIHRPSDFRPAPPSIEVSFKGKVETVYQLPIRNDPKGGIWGSDLNDVLDRIIVGPIHEAEYKAAVLIEKLGEAGISHPEDRVVLCGIPYRQTD